MTGRLEILSSITRFAPQRSDDGPSALIEAAQAAERAGIDNLLIGYSSQIPDGWSLAGYALAHTSSIRVLLAHRPGVMVPTVAARMAATLDVLSGGRFTLNVITGGSPDDQLREGDLVAHDDRYRRSIEYVDIMRRVWSAGEPLDIDGEFYRFRDTSQRLKPVQAGGPTIYMGGASSGAADFAARQADVYMSWAEPVAMVKARFDEVRARCAELGRPVPRFSVSLRLILGDTEDAAWSAANAMLPPDFEETRRRDRHAEDVGRNRQLGLVEESLVHDERLWLGLSAATHGQGGMGALVGTPEQVKDALLRYVSEAGADALLITAADGYFGELPDGFVDALRTEGDKIVAGR
ncbi:LLM class flavin-dependent oxidoreductase [Dactylosporangium salmoneum]|uniref:LLM class flavin-dependent oxidoreductase n=1 Tax=Dactylosporangium salmoneum TaxID=53361 RepID=A0ABN3HY45_9ACTN